MRSPALPRPRRRVLSTAAAQYRRTALPAGRTPWRDAGWCALDFELTGLDFRADEIISFGAIPIDAGRLQLGGAVSSLVRPTRPINEAAIRVHGIRAVDLESAPLLEGALGSLLEAISGRILVVHTAAVERTFLARALRGAGMRRRVPMVDTEILGRLWLHHRDGRAPPRVALSDLAAAVGLPAERAHDALGDALTTAQAFLALATHLEAVGIETVNGLLRAERRLDALRAFSGQ